MESPSGQAVPADNKSISSVPLAAPVAMESLVQQALREMRERTMSQLSGTNNISAISGISNIHDSFISQHAVAQVDQNLPEEMPDQDLPPELPSLSQEESEKSEEKKSEPQLPPEPEVKEAIPDKEPSNAKPLAEEQGIDLLRDAKALIMQQKQ